MKESPAGKAGEIDHDATGPPLVVGVSGVMAVPFSAVKELGLNVMPDGAATSTSMVMVVVALPPVLVAVTVYAVDELSVLGVPEIAPVAVSKERPAESVGVMDQEMTAPPLEVGVAVVIVASFVSVSVLGL